MIWVGSSRRWWTRMVAHEFSRKLSRRVTLAVRNRARAGKRTGRAPFGMVNDGDGGLRHGDRQKLKTVRKIFDWFVSDCMSLHCIANRLNQEKIPAAEGGQWRTPAVRDLLGLDAYRGDFSYGKRQEGRFFTIAKMATCRNRATSDLHDGRLECWIHYWVPTNQSWHQHCLMLPKPG